MAEHDAMRVFVYEVWPCREDGGKTSGWSVTVATDRPDMSDLGRLVRLEVERKFRDGDSRWVGIERAELRAVAALDPRIAVARSESSA